MRYKRLNFGTSSASEIFQHVVKQQIDDIDGVVNISDDVIIFGKTQADHDRALHEVCQRLNTQLEVCQRLNTQLKRKYFYEKLTQFQGDLKKTWKTINQVINKKSSTTVVPCLTVDGQTVRGHKEIACSMNEYFCSIGYSVRKFPEKLIHSY